MNHCVICDKDVDVAYVKINGVDVCQSCAYEIVWNVMKPKILEVIDKVYGT